MGPPLAAKHKLAGAMRELGYSCSASADTFKALLQQYAGRLDEQAVAEVLGLLAATHRALEADALGLADAMRVVLSISGSASSGSASSANSWNVPVIMDGIKAASPNLSWPRVAEVLDHEGFAVPDAAGFSILMAAWRRATTDPFPLGAIAGRVWGNAPGQLSLLVQAVAAPPDVLSWERTAKKIAPLEGMGQGKSPLGTPNQAWASLDLLTVLAQLAELPQLSGGVLELLRRGPASACPEVLVAATAFLRGPQDTNWDVLERFVWGSVGAPLLFDAPPSSSRAVLLARLWQQRSAALLFCMSEFLQERPGRAADLLDVVLEVKGLSSALDQAPPPLAVELAALAAQRKLLDLDKWLAGRLSRDASSGLFMTATLTFLEVQLAAIADGRLAAAERAPAPSSRGGAAGGGPGTAGVSVLSADLTTVFLRGLYTAGASVVPGLAGQLVRALDLAKKAFPAAEAALAAAAASQIGSGAAESGLAAVGGGAFPDAIENEANSYFQKLYHERQPVPELVAQLKAFKAGTPHQQVVFACMVHNLFDEYRFFPNYPDLELDTTAALFGALLHHQLLTNITLGMALRHVLQALAQPPNSKMFRFGLGAISQFKPELHLWPKFCERALAIPHLKSVDAALCTYMEKVVRSGGDGSGRAAADGDLTGAASGSASGLGEGGSAEAAAAAGNDSKQASGSNSGSGGRAAGNVPNGISSSGSKGEQQQMADDGRSGKGGNAANGPADKAGSISGPAAKSVGAGSSSTTSKAAGGGGAAGSASVGAGASGSMGGGSLDTGENLREILSNANVAQAAATMALNDKPTQFERMTLNMTLNNETLDTAERKHQTGATPNDTLTDKVSFLMNNLTVDNMGSKSKDLGSVIIPKYIEWFGNYLVVKRAAQEPNHHKTYVLLLDALAHKDLSKNVLSTTYYYCRALLESDRAITQTNERTLIKQLGSWLGLLTLAKNKPVLAKDMDLKQLIADAYTRGRMIAVLPFVEKVLSGCKDTKVFKATNPMIAGILSMLAEIHAMPRLKLNISFVIEMTFKTFEVSLADVCPSTALRDLPRVQMHNPDFSALPEAKAPAGAALNPALVPPGAPPALTPPPGAMAGAAGGAAGPPGTPPAPAAGAAAGSATPGEAGKGASGAVPASPGVAAAGAAAGTPSASPAGAAAGAVGAAASPAAGMPAAAAAAASAAEPGLLTKLHTYVQISPQLGVLAERLGLKRLVPVAVDRAMCEIITPIVERSVTIACMTTYELVTKDYANDPDESRLRAAAHLMVSSLAGSLALVTCKEPLRVSLGSQLKMMLQPSMDPAMLAQAVELLVNDNLDLGCTIIERAATDKAVRDIDKSLSQAYEARVAARQRNVDFYQRSLMQQQQQGAAFPAALPESLKPKPGNPAQQRVYEDYGRLPRGVHPLPRGYPEGGAPPSSPLQAGMEGAPGAVPDKPDTRLPEGSLHGAALIEGLMTWTAAADSAANTALQRDPNASLEACGSELAPVLGQFKEMLGSEDVTLFCAKRIIRRTWEYLSKVHAGLHAEALALCVSAMGGPDSPGARRICSELTSFWVQINSEAKFNRDVAEALIRKGLLLLPEVDAYLAKLLLQTRTQALGDFAVLLARAVKDGLAGYADVSMSLDLLGKLSAAAGSNEAILQLLSAARQSSRARAAVRAGLPDLTGLKDKQDPPGFHQQVAQLFEDFARRAMANPEEKLHAPFVAQLRQAGLLHLDDMTDRMLRILVELAVNHCLQSEAPTTRPDGTQAPGPLSFLAIDPLVKLMVCLVAGHGGGEAFLNRMLAMTVCLLRRDAEDKAGAFNARPYLRLLLGLASELGPLEEAAAAAASAAQAGAAVQPPPRYLRCLGLVLLMLQPSSVPGFGYAYLEMLSHRCFMPRLLMAPGGAGWPLFEALLIGLLQFLEPALRAAELAEPLRLLYKGTLRLLLVLLHDFPEFLCEHQYRLCEVIPPPAIQMRNLILSAFPRNMRLPDPFTPNLKVDLLPEIAAPPRGVPPADKLLPRPVAALVDSLLQQGATGGNAGGGARTPRQQLSASAVQQLVSMLQAGGAAGSDAAQQQQQQGQQRYSTPLLAGLVLYIAAAAQPHGPVLPGSPAMQLLGRLVSVMDPEGRYLLLNAVANQLRYPNSHTHYFSCVLLALFSEAPRDSGGEEVRAQITRVLLERLIVNRPHPWGLLITFIELIKNPRYCFWQHGFTRCAPEIERLFESVARSCMGVQGGAAAAGKLMDGAEDGIKA